MRRGGLASNLLKDDDGASFVEFTVVFPLLFMATLGLVDLGLLMFGWSDANRAVQLGVRYAATRDPVATGIDGPIDPTNASIPTGTYCTDSAGNTFCILKPTYRCSGATGKCTAISGVGNEKPIDMTKFGDLVTLMRPFVRTLNNSQVVVTYAPLQQGYVGRTSTPMNVTVAFNCVGQPLYFAGALLGWGFPSWNECTGVANSDGIKFDISATLPSEDLSTN